MYLVTVDTYGDEYGSMISAMGIFDTRDKADKAIQETIQGYIPDDPYDDKKVLTQDDFQIDKLSLNIPVLKYIGGYVE